MSGQIVDATIVAAPKQRNTIEEKKAIREGRVPDDWKDKPAKLAQKVRDARSSSGCALDSEVHESEAARGRSGELPFQYMSCKRALLALYDQSRMHG